MNHPVTPDVTLRVTPLTARAAGAVALVHLAGVESQLSDTLDRLTGRTDWAHAPPGRARLCRVAELDDGLVTRLSPTLAQLALHGGVAMVDEIVDRLTQLGARLTTPPAPSDAYPEADSPIEADMLATLATAASPAAVAVLAAQPAIWRTWHADPGRQPPAPQHGLDRLLTPPTVVLVGRPNVGKSTLTNALTARPTAIASPLAGTTRDHLAADTTLALPDNHRLAIRLLDTPGLRPSHDPIEQRAIAAARRAIADADCLIALRDPDTPWPDKDALPRPPDLRIINKADLADTPSDRSSDPHPMPVSALTGQGLTDLTAAIVATLGIPDLHAPHALPPWPFHPTLGHAIHDPAFDWPGYLDAADPQP